MKQSYALLFDMDGVVVDNMIYHTKAWRLFFLDHNVHMNTYEFLSQTSGMPTKDVLAHFLKRRLPKSQVEKLTSQKEFLYRTLYRNKMKPAKGLEPFLKTAKAKGYKIGLGTGSSFDNIDFILDGLNLRKYFDAVVGANNVKKGKPDPETFLTLASKLNTPPKHCIVFEDALMGEKAAHRAGMKFVAVTTSHKASEFKQADKAIRDFSQLTISDISKIFAA
jgi:beta-phosphoglucomutase family hydrolase